MDTTQVVDSRTLHPSVASMPGHLMWRAHARVTLALDEVLPTSVDIHAYAALVALADDRPRSQQEIADLVGISRTTMARVAPTLAAEGLVERVRNPRDRRSYALTRTPAGSAAAHAWQEHSEALQTALTAGFTDAERDDLHDLMLRAAADDVSPQTPPELLASVGFLVSRVHFHLHRDFLAALEPLDLEPRLFGALTALASTGPIPQAELARLLGISGASIVQMADAMERRGLVVRRRDPADRRSQLLHLLPEADDVLVEAGRIAADTIHSTFGALDEEEVARLVTLLQRFITAG